jgi:hypothetical protein
MKNLSIALAFSLLIPTAVNAKVDSDPTGRQTIGKLRLDSLPALTEAIKIKLPYHLYKDVGVREINCAVGQKPADCIPSGIWDTAFDLGDLSPKEVLNRIGKLPSKKVNRASLRNFGFLADAPLCDIVGGIAKENPSFLQQKVNSVSLFDAILNSSGYSTIGKAIGTCDKPGASAKKTIGLENLGKFALGSLPDLIDTPLENFDSFLNSPIADIPVLAQAQILSYANLSLPAGYRIGRFNVVLTDEKSMKRPISGSPQQPNAVCQGSCDYFEMLSLVAQDVFNGVQIGSGKQQVKGGHGALSVVNGGKEPTGFFPFSKGFKLVLNDFNATSGKARVDLYTRYCDTFAGCTPYFVGGFPLFEIKEGTNFTFSVGVVSVPVPVN